MGSRGRHTVHLAHTFGDRVYLRCADGNTPGLVTGAVIRPNGTLYCVGWGDGHETEHYGFELCTEYLPDFAATEPP